MRWRPPRDIAMDAGAANRSDRLSVSSRKDGQRPTRLEGNLVIGLARRKFPSGGGVKPPSGDHPVGRDAERSELKRAFCSSLSEL